MPRRIKQKIEINSSDSLSGLMQETYNDACLQIIDTQKTINELVLTIQPEDIDDITKVAKEKSNLLKVKDSAIRIKLEIAKLQSDIIKNKGDVDATITERTNSPLASTKDFKSIRELLKNSASEEETDN